MPPTNRSIPRKAGASTPYASTLHERIGTKVKKHEELDELEELYFLNSYPGPKEIGEVAKKVRLATDFVRKWYLKRRGESMGLKLCSLEFIGRNSSKSITVNLRIEDLDDVQKKAEASREAETFSKILGIVSSGEKGVTVTSRTSASKPKDGSGNAIKDPCDLLISQVNSTVLRDQVRTNKRFAIQRSQINEVTPMEDVTFLD